MRKATIGLLVVLGSVVAVGQDSVRQWKVVKEVHVNGTATIPPTTILTPKDKGFYRVSAYLSVTSTLNQSSGWKWELDWTDQTGLPSGVLLFTSLGIGTEFQTIDPTVFTVQAGTAIVADVQPSDPPPQDASYEVDFTIERLARTD